MLTTYKVPEFRSMTGVPVTPTSGLMSPKLLPTRVPSTDVSPAEESIRDFRKVYIILGGTQRFDAGELAKEMENNPDFGALQMEIMSDPEAATALLEVRDTSEGDFVFELTSRKTGKVLLAGRGTRPAINQPIAANVTAELVRVLKPLRSTIQSPRAPMESGK